VVQYNDNDNELGCWIRRRNKEIRELAGVRRITNFVKAQRIKWFRLVVRESNSNRFKVVVEWKSTGKRLENVQ
jgi:hypothetical protein